jgi:hypothetical protein
MGFEIVRIIVSLGCGTGRRRAFGAHNRRQLDFKLLPEGLEWEPAKSAVFGLCARNGRMAAKSPSCPLTDPGQFGILQIGPWPAGI